ncbi:MAG: aminotransferase class V-fold PLP-dependent enzyme [Lewinella sp.]|nr:aminotransferase class V-fold PLP-dependent enzyme [Lewinella sp.]
MPTTTFSPAELARFRHDTPGCTDVIHLNNAGAALPPRAVTQAVAEHLQREYQLGGYEAAAERAGLSQDFYPALGDLLNARPEQVAYATSATDAYNKVLASIPWRAGEVIVTTENDYVSNQIAFLQLRDRYGVQVVRAPECEAGGLDIDGMARCIDQHRPRLVAVTHIPTSSGLIQNVAAVGAHCRNINCWYLVDACQSAGQLPLDVAEIGCDFLTATFRKFLRGPRGTGFLYVSDRALEAGLAPLGLDLHSADWTANDAYAPADDARRFETWERNHALMQGAAAAARYAQAIGLERIARRSQQLARQLREQLAAEKQVRVLDRGEQLGAIVTCHVEGADPVQLLRSLRQRRIHTSITRLDSARLDYGRKQVEWALRWSPHYYNNEVEIEKAVQEFFEIIC